MRKNRLYAHRDTGEIWRITEIWQRNENKFSDKLVEIHDATNTRNEYWHKEDFKDSFVEVPMTKYYGTKPASVLDLEKAKEAAFEAAGIDE